jgi:hypothetical protein
VEEEMTVINTVSAGMSMTQPPKMIQNLSEDQQIAISDILSQFDADNLNEENALSIVEAFSQAGIQPSSALEKSIYDLGFDAKNIGELANVIDKDSRPPSPPPPQQSNEEKTSMVDYLAELLEEKLADNKTNILTNEDKESILAQVYERFDIEHGESIINTHA